jgi:Replication-relaxation
MKALGITPKQLEILILLYRFRFLSSKQVQEILGHKDRKRSRACLSDLVSKGYVKSSYERNKLGENNKPAIFNLTVAAVKVLKDREECRALGFRHLYGENGRSRRFIDHCLLLADIYLEFREKSENRDADLHFLTKSDQCVFEAFPKPLPDAYIAIKSSSRKTRRYFLEITDPDTPRFALRWKVKRYFTYEESGGWRRHHNSQSPTIILICPDEKTKVYSGRYAASVSKNSHLDMRFFCHNKFDISLKDFLIPLS